MLKRLTFWVASTALTLGIAVAWATRKRAAIAAEERGLPANYDELNAGQKKRAEKQRRKTLGRNEKRERKP